MKYIKPLTFYIDLDLSCQPIMASVNDTPVDGIGEAADIHINIWDDEEIIDDNTIN